MTIAEVIGWKFNHQAGMRCTEIDGVMTIVEFPGGIPSEADQATWTAEYEAHVAEETKRQGALAKLQDLDVQSIRGLREVVAQLPGAPQQLKDIELEAVAERAKLGQKQLGA